MVRRYVRYGVSPRGAQAIVLGSKIRALIEGFLRGRYGLRLRPLAVPLLIGAVLVVGWILLGPLLTIPRFTTEGPVVRNGYADPLRGHPPSVWVGTRVAKGSRL